MAMREPKTETIEGQTYEVTPLPAGRMIHTAVRLARMIAPSLKNIDSLRAATEALQEVMLHGVGDILENLSAEQFETLCRDLATATMVQGPRGNTRLAEIFDLHFQGDLMGLLQWLKFAVQVNFGPLFYALEQPAAAAPSAPAAPAGA